LIGVQSELHSLNGFCVVNNAFWLGDGTVGTTTFVVLSAAQDGALIVYVVVVVVVLTIKNTKIEIYIKANNYSNRSILTQSIYQYRSNFQFFTHHTHTHF
jgi:tetrahydromethanopterin S-methyltransferase subunit E